MPAPKIAADEIFEPALTTLNCFIDPSVLPEDELVELRPQKLMQQFHESYQAIQACIRKHAGKNENEILRCIQDHAVVMANLAKTLEYARDN